MNYQTKLRAAQFRAVCLLFLANLSIVTLSAAGREPESKLHREFCQNILGMIGGSVESFGKQSHADYNALFNEYKEARSGSDPTEDEVKDFWKTNANNAKKKMPPFEKLSSRYKEYLFRYVKYREYYEDNKEQIKLLRESYANGLFDLFCDANSVQSDSDYSIVFLPVPCPNLGLYADVRRLLIKICDSLERINAKAFIVTSVYGIESENPRSYIAGTQPQEYPFLFKKHIEADRVELVTRFPGGHNTPFVFVFHKGRIVFRENMLSVATSYEEFLRLFQKEGKSVPTSEK